MYYPCGTNYRAPRWTFTIPCKPEVRQGAREESASPRQNIRYRAAAILRRLLKERVPLPPHTYNATDDTCMNVMDVDDKELLALLENPDVFKSVENVPSEK